MSAIPPWLEKGLYLLASFRKPRKFSGIKDFNEWLFFFTGGRRIIP